MNIRHVIHLQGQYSPCRHTSEHSACAFLCCQLELFFSVCKYFDYHGHQQSAVKIHICQIPAVYIRCGRIWFMFCFIRFSVFEFVDLFLKLIVFPQRLFPIPTYMYLWSRSIPTSHTCQRTRPPPPKWPHHLPDHMTRGVASGTLVRYSVHIIFPILKKSFHYYYYYYYYKVNR